MHFDEVIVVEFLTSLFVKGSGYSAVNTARCALSTFLINDNGVTVGNSPLVKRFLKGIFELKPPMPRYNCIWDVNIVLDYLRELQIEDCSLSILTYKMVMLLALTTRQRAQTLHAISVKDIQFAESVVFIPVRKLLKHSNQRHQKTQLCLKKFSDKNICVVSHLKLYIEKTAALRGQHSQMFISYVQPHLPVSKDTISRWIKSVMVEAGIDTTVFKPHSTRAASSSAAVRDDVPIDQILKSAGWSNCNTFKKFYDKVILPRYI